MTPTPRDEATVKAFVERLGAMLTELGMPRMASRVFSCLVASEHGHLTAAELVDRLQASPAGVSGAVRYLSQVGLVSRERQPGTRRDIYHVDGDLWYEAVLRRDPALQRFAATMRDGVRALGEDSEAGARLAETVAFFDFLLEEMPQMMDRWKIRREELRSQN